MREKKKKTQILSKQNSQPGTGEQGLSITAGGNIGANKRPNESPGKLREVNGDCN